MKLVFVTTGIILGGLICVCIFGENSSSAQSLNQQECSQLFLSSVDQNLPDAIALNDGEGLQAAIERIFGCNVSLSKFEPLSARMNFQNGKEFGAYKGLAYNRKTQEIGAFVELHPVYSASNNLVVIPSDMIDKWTYMGANVKINDETISKLSVKEYWIPYIEKEQAHPTLPDNFVQAVFKPPTKSFVIFVSVPSGAEIYVSEKLIGNTKVEGYLNNNRHDAVRFEMVGFKDCDLSSGAVVKHMDDQSVSFECKLSAVNQ